MSVQQTPADIRNKFNPADDDELDEWAAMQKLQAIKFAEDQEKEKKKTLEKKLMIKGVLDQQLREKRQKNEQDEKKRKEYESRLVSEIYQKQEEEK